MSQSKLTPTEIQFLQEALSTEIKLCDIRLREGEYQYDLAKAITSFQLRLHFPNVKEIIESLYGAEKAKNIQFIRKIQTILKKMEKSNVIRILPKKKPWELQRYALLGFKFQDAEKNLVVLATDQQIKQALELLRSTTSQIEKPSRGLGNKAVVCVLIAVASASYVTILWDLTQPVLNPVIFTFAFSIATICSLILGKKLSLRR